MSLLYYANLTAQVSKADTTVFKADSTIYEKVDQKAAYRGSWLNHVQRNLNMRVPVNNGAPYGTYTVVIGFVINTDGSLTDFSKLTDMGYGMEEETIRVIKKSGRWIPALLNEKAVRSYRKQPLTFLINRM
ncbi:energy transducer TonB [Niabella hibiscisoli]|uniref:energy transducer TonB n=1 Tax=Niabella hibiscisoli TaxID=1825928 RepID=UPI001F0D6BEF|nr:energy transducer TonB [Niabella hibiscisoli]MCH5721367.1 energy transducer TonB [Niabella hibiscisoli]